MSKKRKLDCIIEKFSTSFSLEDKQDIQTQLDEHAQKLELILSNQKKILNILEKLLPTDETHDTKLGIEYNYFV